MTIDNLDFESIQLEEKPHIGISVKDFKAIVTHAETLKTNITALYSFPTRPMQITYQEHGIQCEFTLMTIGDYRGASVTPAPAAVRQESSAPVERPESRSASTLGPAPKSTNTMPPPSQPVPQAFARDTPSQKVQRPPPRPPKASVNPESIFLPTNEDEDRQWGERNYDDDEDTLGWSSNAAFNVSVLRLPWVITC